MNEPEGPARGRPAADRLWVPALAGLILSVAFVGALLIRAEGDVSLLVHAAPPWTSPETAPDSLTVQDPEHGFDGQFFYRLGADPWSTDDEVAGVTYDLPSLRNARWGYGALAWVVSGGDTDLVPWSLVVVNLTAAAAVGAAGGALARSAGRHAGWGVLFVLWPGFAYSLSLDTSELVASALVLAGLVGLRHQRWGPAAVALSAAVITRDTTAVFPFAVLVAGLVHLGQNRHRDTARGLVGAGAVPLVVFGAWQLVQLARFGALPLTSSGDNNLGAPLAGLVDLVTSAVPPSGADEAFRLVSAVGLVALVMAAGVALAVDHRLLNRTPRPRPDGAPRWRVPGPVRTAEALAWLGATGVVVLLNAYLWSGATAFMRASTEAGMVSILVLVTSGRLSRTRRMALAGGLAGLWLLTAAAQLSKLAP